MNMMTALILNELLWLLPLVVALMAVSHAIYSYRRRSSASVVMRCLVLTVVVMVAGAVGSWISGLQMWKVVGIAHDVSLELLYEGWQRSWWPLFIAGAASMPILGIATAAFRKTIPPTRNHMELSTAFAIPAIAVLFLVATGLVIEVMVNPLGSSTGLYTGPIWVAWVFALATIGYYTLALCGVPYALAWGIALYLRRKSASNEKSIRAVSIFFIVFTLLAIGFTLLFVASSIRGHNPYL